MRKFKVIALSVGAKNKIFESGDIVSEDNFDENEADFLVKEGFLEEIKGAKKEKAEKESDTKKGKGKLNKLLETIGN